MEIKGFKNTTKKVTIDKRVIIPTEVTYSGDEATLYFEVIVVATIDIWGFNHNGDLIKVIDYPKVMCFGGYVTTKREKVVKYDDVNAILFSESVEDKIYKKIGFRDFHEGTEVTATDFTKATNKEV